MKHYENLTHLNFLDVFLQLNQERVGRVVVPDLRGSGMHHHQVEVPRVRAQLHPGQELDLRARVGSLVGSEERPRGPADRKGGD